MNTCIAASDIPRLIAAGIIKDFWVEESYALKNPDMLDTEDVAFVLEAFCRLCDKPICDFFDNPDGEPFIPGKKPGPIQLRHAYRALAKQAMQEYPTFSNHDKMRIQKALLRS